MKNLIMVLLTLVSFSAFAQTNDLNQNITIAFGPCIHSYKDVYEKQLLIFDSVRHTHIENGFQHIEERKNELVFNYKFGYDFKFAFVEADFYTRLDFHTNIYLAGGFNIHAGERFIFSPIAGTDLKDWYYGCRINIKPVYLQAVRYTDANGNYAYNLVLGLRGSLFE